MEELVKKLEKLLREIENDADAYYNAGVIDSIELIKKVSNP